MTEVPVGPWLAFQEHPEDEVHYEEHRSPLPDNADVLVQVYVASRGQGDEPYSDGTDSFYGVVSSETAYSTPPEGAEHGTPDEQKIRVGKAVGHAVYGALERWAESIQQFKRSDNASDEPEAEADEISGEDELVSDIAAEYGPDAAAQFARLRDIWERRRAEHESYEP